MNIFGYSLVLYTYHVTSDVTAAWLWRELATKIMESKDYAKHNKAKPTEATFDHNSNETYFESLLTKLNQFKTELTDSYRSQFMSSQNSQSKPAPEGIHHAPAPNEVLDSNDDIESLPSYDIPPQPELCPTDDEESSDDALDASSDANDETFSTPKKTQNRGFYSYGSVDQVRGHDGFWHPAGDLTPQSHPRTPHVTPTVPNSCVSTPQSAKSQHWYKDENQKQHMKYLLNEDPLGVKNLFTMKRLSHIDLPHGPFWCRALCRELDPRYRPAQCGYTGKDLPGNFQACSYSCTGAWCTCVASYSGRGYWS